MDRSTPVEVGLRRTVVAVALANLAYFGIEFGVALRIGSVSLLADSVDFLEDASINLLIFAAIGWSVRRRARGGMALAAIMLVPAAAFLWTLAGKLAHPVPPEPLALGATGLGAMAVNLGRALLLARHRHHSSSLARAAFLSARNDVVANVAIIGAGLATLHWPTIWPDVVVGLGIAWINLDAAREVWVRAREEHRSGAIP